MSWILNEITVRYPSFGMSISSTPTDEASDLTLMGELASYAVGLFESGNLEGVRYAFDLTERLLGSPQTEERDAAELGFLETIQNVSSHRAYGMAAFEQFLGPKSQVVWVELTEIWQGKSSLAEVAAAETGASSKPRWWQFWKSRTPQRPGDLLKDVQNPELRKIIEQITRE